LSLKNVCLPLRGKEIAWRLISEGQTEEN
jgi:hypothetical protein